MTPIHDERDDDDDAKGGFEKAVESIADAFSQLGQAPAAAETGDALFFSAVRSGNTAKVKSMIAAGADPNGFNKNGDTPLHIAARANLADMADLLISLGADPQKGKKDKPQHTPMHDAVNFGKPEITELLAARGGYQPGNREDGWTLLHRACEKGKTRLVAALLAGGADANELTDNGATPLIISIMRLQPATAELLLGLPAAVAGISRYEVGDDSRKCNAFQLAVEKNQTALVEKMLAQGVTPNMTDEEGNTPLLVAIEKGNTALVTALLAAGADVNRGPAQSSAPLHAACNAPARKTEIITALLQAGADPDAADVKSGMTALAAAAAANDATLVKILLAYGASPDAADNDNGNAVFQAVEHKSTELLSLLLAAGADVNRRHGADMATPLIAAVQHKNVAAVETLLRSGADPMMCDRDHKSPLFFANDWHYRNETVIKLLEESLARKIPASKPRRNAP